MTFRNHDELAVSLYRIPYPDANTAVQFSDWLDATVKTLAQGEPIGWRSRLALSFEGFLAEAQEEKLEMVRRWDLAIEGYQPYQQMTETVTLADGLPAGLYLVRATAGKQTETALLSVADAVTRCPRSVPRRFRKPD